MNPPVRLPAVKVPLVTLVVFTLAACAPAPAPTSTAGAPGTQPESGTTQPSVQPTYVLPPDVTFPPPPTSAPEAAPLFPSPVSEGVIPVGGTGDPSIVGGVLIPQYDGVIVSPYSGEPITIPAASRSQPTLVAISDEAGGLLYQRSQSGPILHLPANALLSEVLVGKGPDRILRVVGMVDGSLYYLADDVRLHRVDIESRQTELLLEREEAFFSREVPSISTDGTFIAIRHATDPVACIESSWFEFIRVGEEAAFEVDGNPLPAPGNCQSGLANWLQVVDGVAYWLEHPLVEPPLPYRPMPRSLDLTTGEVTDYDLLPEPGEATEAVKKATIGSRVPLWARTVMRVNPGGTITTWDVGSWGMKVGTLGDNPLLTEFEAAAPLGFKPIFPYTSPIYIAEGARLAP